MALSNLAQGNSRGLDTSVKFSAQTPTSSFTVDGLQSGTNNVVQFTIYNMDPSTYTVQLSADATQVVVNIVKTVSKPNKQNVVYTVNTGQNEVTAQAGSSAVTFNLQNTGQNGTVYTFTKATGGGDV